MSNLITRAQWGARPPKGARNRLDPNPKGVAVHWNGPGCAAAIRTHDKCAGFLRGIQDFHMRTRGWSDIAYSLFACPHGYVFEGRGRGIGTAANGTNYGNRYYYAVYAMWGQGDGPAPAPLLNAIRRGIDLCQTWGAGSDITVHNAFLSTTCPGPELTAWVKAGAKAGVATKPKPTPAKKPAASKSLVVDGVRGPATIKALQRWVGTTPDGTWGLATRRALQRKLGVTADGNVGPATIKALQRRVGARQDGLWGPATTKALQQHLNKGGWAR